MARMGHHTVARNIRISLEKPICKDTPSEKRRRTNITPVIIIYLLNLLTVLITVGPGVTI